MILINKELVRMQKVFTLNDVAQMKLNQNTQKIIRFRMVTHHSR